MCSNKRDRDHLLWLELRFTDTTLPCAANHSFAVEGS